MFLGNDGYTFHVDATLCCTYEDAAVDTVSPNCVCLYFRVPDHGPVLRTLKTDDLATTSYSSHSTPSTSTTFPTVIYHTIAICLESLLGHYLSV